MICGSGHARGGESPEATCRHSSRTKPPLYCAGAADLALVDDVCDTADWKPPSTTTTTAASEPQSDQEDQREENWVPDTTDYGGSSLYTCLCIPRGRGSTARSGGSGGGRAGGWGGGGHAGSSSAH